MYLHEKNELIFYSFDRIRLRIRK